MANFLFLGCFFLRNKQRIQATPTLPPLPFGICNIKRCVVTAEEIALSDIGVIPLHFSNKGCIRFMRIAPLQYRELL